MTGSRTTLHAEIPLAPRPAIVVLLCAIVLAFRAAVWLNPSSYITLPESLALPLAGLGVSSWPAACGPGCPTPRA